MMLMANHQQPNPPLWTAINVLYYKVFDYMERKSTIEPN